VREVRAGERVLELEHEVVPPKPDLLPPMETPPPLRSPKANVSAGARAASRAALPVVTAELGEPLDIGLLPGVGTARC
jgi:hypothetical protein